MEALLKDFIDAPNKYWKDNPRQQTKFRKRTKAIKSLYSWSDDDMRFFVVKAAKWRLTNRHFTAYIPSHGSSGSHLVQKILDKCVPTHPLGEVYLPPELTPKIDELGPAQASLMVEAYNLLHTTSPSRLFSPCLIVNTAHYSNLQEYSRWTRHFRSMLIIRHPVDLVVSKTFRKPEYRRYSGHSNTDDWEYLNLNIDNTLRFYESALDTGYQRIVKFEDVIGDAKAVVPPISSLLEGYGVDAGQIVQAVNSSANSGQDTNKYSGEVPTVDRAYADYAANRLTDITERLGY